jgi:anti-sigma regulatory factor (Ser/Thr protein kinase)
MEKKFTRNIDTLANIFEFTGAFFDQYNLETGVRYAVDLAIEELFTNMVKYSRESSQKVSISLKIEGNQLVIRLVDEDVEPFDISALPEVDTQKPLEDRPIGGLGLYLTQKIMDDIRYEYEYRDRRSKITLTKNLNVVST